MEIPYFDRRSLTFSARRVTQGIQLSARFDAPKLSTGEPGRYVASIAIDPKSRAVTGDNFSYSRDGSKYLAQHGAKTNQLRKWSQQIRDRFLASPAWTELKDRGADPYFIVDHLGNVTKRIPAEIRPEFFGERDDTTEG